MKTLGIIRRIDDVGRVTVPKGIYKMYGIKINDPLEIYADSEKIVLKKYEPNYACMFCEEIENVIEFRGKPICRECLEGLSAND